MRAFIKAIHGNVSAAGKYFREGVVTPVDEETANHPEIESMVNDRYLAIFSSEEAANNHTFKSMSERFLAGEDISLPAKEEVEKVEDKSLPPSDNTKKETKIKEKEKDKNPDPSQNSGDSNPPIVPDADKK